MPAWPVINQLCFPERHFSANGISLRLSEVQMKFYERSLQALLSSAPRGFAARSRVLARLASLAQIGELVRRLLAGVYYQSGPQPDLDIWWRQPHLQNGAHSEKHEGRSLPGSLLRLEVSFPHTTLRAVTLDNEKSGVWRKNAVRWTFVRLDRTREFFSSKKCGQGGIHLNREGEFQFSDP